MQHRIFFEKESSTLSHLLWDSQTLEAVLIDPCLPTIDRDLLKIKELDLNLKYLINTHCHADHITSSGEIKKVLSNVKSIISGKSGAKADIHAKDGDQIVFGDCQLVCIETPGHTSGCITFHAPREQKLFTGDTLLIRGCGRTDFQEGNAGLLYDNIHTKLFTLPEETNIFPAHNYVGVFESSIREEKKFNPRLTKTRAEFVQIMEELGLPNPKMLDVAVPLNLNCGV